MDIQNSVSLVTGGASGLGYEALVKALFFSSKDRQEGVSAFLEKRKPQFTGE